MRYPVNLVQSVNTDSPAQDVKPFCNGPHRQFEGIERDGGLTNLYRQDVAVAANASTIVTDSGEALQLGPVAGTQVPVYLNGVQISSFPYNYIKAQSTEASALDAATTAAGTVLYIFKDAAGSVRLEERSTAGAILNSRSIAIVGAPAYTLCAIVRSAALAYANMLKIVFLTSAGWYYFIEGGGAPTVTGILGTTLFETPYVYEYENPNTYLIASPSAGRMAVGNIAGGGALAGFDGKYAVLQVSGGFSRHIITKAPILAAPNIEALGIVGHNAFTAVFTAAPVWQNPAGIAATAVSLFYRVLYGGVEVFYTEGGIIKEFYAPEPGGVNLVSVGIQTSDDTIARDFFGELANNVGAGAGAGLSLRIISINGVQSHISAALVNSQQIGVNISPIGEFDESYVPSIYGTNAETEKVVIYKYNETFYCIHLSTIVGTPPPAQRVGRNLYKLPTIGPYNLINTEERKAYASSLDWNGRMAYTGAGGTARSLRVLQNENRYSGGVDTGEKAHYTTAATSPICNNTTPPPVGYAEQIWINEYKASEYVRSWANASQNTIREFLEGTLYLPSLVLPVSVGATYYPGSAVRFGESYLIEDGLDSYLIGNRIDKAYMFFKLFGNLYAYNEGVIYLAPLNTGGYVQTLQPMAVGQSLQLIATSPTAIYFVSTWDNSLYTFDGGRSLQKVVRLNQEEAIIKGCYSVTEGSLLLETLNTLLYVRDTICTRMPKNADMVAGCALYVADDGIHIVATASRYRYTYRAVGTVQPLRWKSAYFGRDGMMLDYCRSAVFTIYNPAKTTLNLIKRAEAFDEGGEYLQEEVETINAVDYTEGGYYRARMQPALQQAIGNSIGIEIDGKAILLDVALTVEPFVDSTIASERSS